jgi:chemotaxis signal transduction protein
MSAADERAIRARQLLHERARMLARPPESAAPADALEAIRFRVGDARYAVDARHVLEVFRARERTALPGAEAPVAGLTAWRGDLLTLYALAAPAQPAEAGAVLVLGQESPAFGVLADVVEGLTSIPLDSIGPLPRHFGARRDYLRGVTGDAVLILDAVALIHTYAPGSDP